MTKQEIIKRLEKKDKFSSKEVISLVNGLTRETTQPKEFKKGDVFLFEDLRKKRPFCLYRINTETCILISLTTTNDCLASIPYNSRFLREGYLGKTIKTLKNSDLKGKFIGTMDNLSQLNEAYNQVVKSLR